MSLEDSEPVLQSWPDFWNPVLELFFHAHIGIYMEVLVDEKELGELHSRVILLLISCATKVKSAVFNSTRPARLTAVLGSRSFPHSASSDARQNKSWQDV